MAVVVEVKYFNSFWLKKVVQESRLKPSWPGLPWNPTGYPKFPFNSDKFAEIGIENGEAQHWSVEEMQIKGGYNNTSVDLGVKAYIVNDSKKQENLSNSLIYSGIYNSRTGINQTNVFSVGEPITKSLNPINGSIQRLYAEDTNLITFQENKVSRILIDKDAVYSAEGGGTVTSSKAVLGQTIPFLGEYGISKNPESFAIFGYRKYFADRNRGVILRLSRDGITEISSYGMTDYFRDYLSDISYDWHEDEIAVGFINSIVSSSPIFQATNSIVTVDLNSPYVCCDIELGSIVHIGIIDSNTGTWAVDSDGNYLHTSTGLTVININETDIGCELTLSGLLPEFEGVSSVAGVEIFIPIKLTSYVKSKLLGGWDIHKKNYVISMQKTPSYTSTDIDSYSTVAFDEMINGWTSFHTYKPTFTGSLKNKYYSFFDGKLYMHYNEASSNNYGKYYGATTPTESSVTFVFNPKASVSKNFHTMNYEGSSGWEVDSFSSGFEEPNETDYGSGIFSNTIHSDNASPILSHHMGEYTENGINYRVGFNRKENKYSASLKKAIPDFARPGEVFFGNETSGIKGYFATVKMSTDEETQPGGRKELYAVSSNYAISSY